MILSVSLRLVLVLLVLLSVSSVQAHETRPGSLEISWEQSSQVDTGAWQVRWRQPVLGDYAVDLRPQLSSGWLQQAPDERVLTETSLILFWTITAPADALGGQQLLIEGLDSTITDVLVKASFGDGSQWQALVKPADPAVMIPAHGDATSGVYTYLGLGFEHILTGADHLVFVLGLVLLIRDRRSLVLAITAFTLAHSLTLVALALEWINLAPAPVEAVIALSILFVALAVVRGRQHRDLLVRLPWLAAFAFGLLHGCGFAGALLDIGLPRQGVVQALLLFNTGIELGQLVFVIPVLALMKLIYMRWPGLQLSLERLLAYGIGSMAAFWLIQRLILLA